MPGYRLSLKCFTRSRLADDAYSNLAPVVEDIVLGEFGKEYLLRAGTLAVVGEKDLVSEEVGIGVGKIAA